MSHDILPELVLAFAAFAFGFALRGLIEDLRQRRIWGAIETDMAKQVGARGGGGAMTEGRRCYVIMREDTDWSGGTFSASTISYPVAVATSRERADAWAAAETAKLPEGGRDYDGKPRRWWVIEVPMVEQGDGC